VDEDKIMGLMCLPVVEQRTVEWLEMRHNMLSASNIYRAFKSPATIASLVREKSVGFGETPVYQSKGGLSTPMGWGTLFERVSVAIYEYVNDTEVGEFGCIQHPEWDFIGASPDGINISPGERFGRMLEIKNIYNRDITGVPADEYWVQMQVQMEVCDLPLCDFLETRFCLYDTVEEFVKGEVEWFRGALVDCGGEYQYHYLWEYDGDVEAFVGAVTAIAEEVEYASVHWWYLDEFSCVLVERNRDWFRAVFPRMRATWDEIVQMRLNGGGGGATKKKGGICLIKLDE
jgi:hypothetical protein